MATAEPAPPYNDGSSTESEYYFDPAEEAEELAAYAWEHALDAPAPPNQPQGAKLNENIAIKQEFSDYRSASDGSEEIALPQGSEWSHGAAGAAVCDDAVERALAMASRFEREMRNAQRDEALTADTLNGNDHEHEEDEKPPGEIEQKDKTVMRSLSSTYSGEVKVKAKMKSKIVSLKSVKTSTPPASTTNSVVVGLRRPPTKVVGAPSELERGLSVARSQWRATGSQKASPMNSKTSQAKSEEVTVAAGKRGEQVKSPSMSTELEKVSSRRRTEHSERPDKSTQSRPDAHSKCQSRHHSRSPSKRQTERPTRTDRSKSLARHRSRSRSRGREENERRSRSPYRSTVSVSPRSRSHRHEDRSLRSRNENESERRSNHRDERSRSPPRYLRYESRSASRCRDRGLNDHHKGSRQIRHDNDGVEHARHDITEKLLDLRRPSNRESDTSRETQHNKKKADGYHRQDSHRTQTARVSAKKEVQVLSKQGSNQIKSGCDAKNGAGPIGRNCDRGASKPQLDKSDSVRPRPASNVVTTPTADQATKRSPKDPRVRAQVGMNASHQNTSKKPSTFRHIFDEFERKVHKLKLREADLNEKEAAQTSNRRDSRNFGNRRRGIAMEKAQLEAQDLERFEKLYESMTVSKVELATYQMRREFAYRVVCYKRKQAALQEQTGGQTPEETAMHWRRLDEERERLVQENSELFHNVMIGQHELGRTYEMRGKRGPRKAEKRSRSSDPHDGQPFLKRIARGLNAAHRQLDDLSSSRVVAGASLRHQSEDTPLPPQSSNTPWFLKG